MSCCFICFMATRREGVRQVQANTELAMSSFQQHNCSLVEHWSRSKKNCSPVGRRLPLCDRTDRRSQEISKERQFQEKYFNAWSKGKAEIRLMLEFFNACTPVFEQVLCLFQKSAPVTHMLYDCISDLLKRSSWVTAQEKP